MKRCKKRPAFQWYPGDHRRDVAVQACSFEARALWREMLDLMHDGEPRGHLTAGGSPIHLSQLARMIGVQETKVSRWLAELEERKVFSRTDAGVIFSRRMVRDERKRKNRAAGGYLSLQHPNVPKPKRPDKQPQGRERRIHRTIPSSDPSGGPLQFASASAGASEVRAAHASTQLLQRFANPERAHTVLARVTGNLSASRLEAWLSGQDLPERYNAKPLNDEVLLSALEDLSETGTEITRLNIFAFYDRAMRDAQRPQDIAATPNEEALRSERKAKQGNVEQRRLAPDGPVWWERIRREAKASGRDPWLYGFDHLHEPGDKPARQPAGPAAP